jgi:putative DNA primase/helicase
MSDTEKLDQGTNPLNQGNTYGPANKLQAYSGCKYPIQNIQIAIQKMEPAPMVDLAEKYYGKPTLDANGETRKLKNSEVVVLVSDHFKNWLEEIGMGACSINGKVHIFVGTHWQLVEDADCKILLGEIAARIGHDASESKSCKFCRELLEQLHFCLTDIKTKSDKNRVLINFRNGTLDVFEGHETLRDFRRTDNLNYQLPFDYDEAAKCPMFENFLLKVLPDMQSRAVLSEFFGWLFLKDLKLEKALFLYGTGHNGKSVFFDVITSLLGEQNVSELDLSELSEKKNRFHLATVLLNFGSEITDRCNATLLKKLTSGEPVTARRLYKDIYTIRDYGRLAFNANVLPKNSERTEGFFRRFLIIPFIVTISDSEKDPDLAKKIIATEMPGVFNWVMQGLRRLREARKFSPCEASTIALSNYKKERDSVSLFLEERGLQSSPDDRIKKDDLFKEYKHFCTSSGYMALAKNLFGSSLMKDHQIDESKSGSDRFWKIVRRVTEGNDDDESQ